MKASRSILASTLLAQTFALSSAVMLASPVAAQSSAHVPWTQITVQSAKLGGARPVYVVTPSDYATSGARYPVLVLLDAEDEPQFTSAVANVAFLASRSAIPKMIIVGVPNGKDRTHDLTPVATGSAAKDFPTAGGAATLTDFIADEVLPLVRSKYRTLPTTVLAGHSFGGLFAMHAASAKRGVFAGIVAMSASLWWNDSTSAIAYADSIAKSPATARLFATSGEYEPPIAITVKRFSAHLDSIRPAGLAFGHQHYADDTHGLTPVPSLMDGLRFVFEPVSLAVQFQQILSPPFDSVRVMATFAELEKSYQAGART
ncbi:MAG TPA: alpha/beta hydrolase-fold protein, partial [Casimicrobiaceae bacterium]